ncbi:RNA methyltransferase [Micrococcales bacterium 31B]|nr:RNA methyltransferase [Micrococcales bacterium 31B]
MPPGAGANLVDLASVPEALRPLLDDYFSLTDVKLRSKSEPEKGVFLAESSTVLRRALAAGYEPKSFLVAPKWVPDLADVFAAHPDAPVFVGSAGELEQITGFHLHRGALAAMKRRPDRSVGEVIGGARRVAVLEDIVDHTNVGALFRSAAALGVDAVLVTPACADPLYRRSIRVSMGTVFQVPWARFTSWPDGMDELHEAGFETLALALRDDSLTLDEVEANPFEKMALIFGTEGDGLRPRTLARARHTVRIPMAGAVDSLNVAAASAVVFWATRDAK